MPEDGNGSEDREGFGTDTQDGSGTEGQDGSGTDAQDGSGTDAQDETVDGRETPPEGVIDEAERLTRLARDAVDDAEAAVYRDARDEALTQHDYVARVRQEDDGAVLVCHPAEWLEDGVVRPDRIDDLDRGIERRVAGTGEPDQWEAVEAHNRDLARTVATRYGDVHGANAHALADFMGNHYAKPVEDATRAELEEFLDEYFPRNAFPSEAQREYVEESVALVFEAADDVSPLGE
jgi:hypothetical protein